MPTKRRQVSKTGIYHVIVKGINKEKIFNQQREKIYFKSIILKYLEKYQTEIYCYCIMSNHAHFIIRAEIQVLSMFMASILAEYASYYNFKHYRNGHVFQNRFRSECIENKNYFWTCLRYIHLNPVKAGILKKPERYRYSSMAEYMLETPVLLHQNAIVTYRNHFRDYEEFDEFHKKRASEIFVDVPDEILSQQLELAMVAAEDVFIRNKLTLLNQVFEEKKIREEYIQELKQMLKISKKRAKELCIITMNRIENE